jgi:hypothetical protein
LQTTGANRITAGQTPFLERPQDLMGVVGGGTGPNVGKLDEART